MAADLLRRACELLGCSEVSAADNLELLRDFAAGGSEGVLICSATHQCPVVAAEEAPTTDPQQPPTQALTEAAADARAGPEAHDAQSGCAPADVQGLQVELSKAGLEASSSALQAGSAGELEAAAAPVQAASIQPVIIEQAIETEGLIETRLYIVSPGPLPPKLEGCPAVYFYRADTNTGGSTGQQLAASDKEEQEGPAVFFTLLPTGPSLTSLQLLLTHVLAPLVAPENDAPQLGGGSCASADAAPTPAAEEGQATSASSGGSTRRSSGSSSGSGSDAFAELHAELAIAAHKLAAQAAACAKHMRNEVAVELPAVDLQDVAAAARSEEAVLACERCMEEWIRLATGVLLREAAQHPAGRGPMAELEFWQARAEVYSGLLEQLSVPAVRATQSVVEAGSLDKNLAASFRTQLSDINRLTLEARDNAKFLLTLERHFRALASGSLRSVADALRPMLNALRMIWVVSRYYKDDLHMSNLLERIAQGLQDRLDGAMHMGSLFQVPVAQSLQLVRTCRAIADGWQAHYMAMREKIEASGHHARWEFNKQLLFERTIYAAEVCGELASMVQAVDDFRQFLGPELKAVTGDATVIEEVSVMVQAMVEPVEGVAFDPLDKAAAAEWKAVRQRFARDADDIKLATRDLIDTCFRKLRSVDAAPQLLHSFQRIQAQGAMQQQMTDKLAAVLEHFIREIHAVRRLFEEGRDNPPLTRNMPPVAGAIRWSRGLLVRLRRTWLKLQALKNDLEALEPGRRAASAMTELSKEMLRYEKARFAAWSATVDAAVASGLQQVVLCRKVASPSGSPTGSPQPGGLVDSNASCGCDKVVINFPPGLLRVMREAKYLDQLGFVVPRLAVNLALQEGQLREHFQSLGSMLDRHRAATAQIHSTQRAILVEQLSALEAVLEPGLTRINWTSLTIPQFVASVNQAVDQFTALVAQVQKNTTMIEKTIFHIMRAKLLPPDAPGAHPANTRVRLLPSDAPPAAAGAHPANSGTPTAPHAVDVAAADAVAQAPEQAAGAGLALGAVQEAEVGHRQGPEERAAGPDVPELQDFADDFEQHRQQVVAGLVARYRSVGPLLIKVEELVAGTATGKSPRLAGYYAYWEGRLFGAINSLVVSSLQAVQSRMQACTPGSRGNTGGVGGSAQHDAEDAERQTGKPPLFMVSLSSIQGEVVVVPSTAEVSKALQRLLHNVVESAKPFVRWMDGTCLEAPELNVYGEDAEPFVFSFFSDVSQSPAVVRALLGAQHKVQRATVAVGRVAAGWRTFGALWRGDREAALAKLRSRKLGAAAAEERMAQYQRVGEEAWAAGGDQDVHFVRVRCGPLAAAVRDEAQAWVRGIAQIGVEADTEKLEPLRQQAAKLMEAVQTQPEDEAGMQAVKEAVEAIQKEAQGAQAACEELEGHARGRLLYAAPQDVAALQEQLAAVLEVRDAWRQLVGAAVEREEQGWELPPAVGASHSRGSVSSHVDGGLSRTFSSASTHSTASTRRKGSVRAGSRSRQGARQ